MEPMYIPRRDSVPATLLAHGDSLEETSAI